MYTVWFQVHRSVKADKTKIHSWKSREWVTLGSSDRRECESQLEAE